MRREYNFYVYIMASDSGTLYVGMTNNLERRVYEHKHELIDGFSKKYKCHKLVYYEHCEYVYDALNREKQLKNWRREKKQNLIKTINPHWKDLSKEWEGFDVNQRDSSTSPSFADATQGSGRNDTENIYN